MRRLLGLLTSFLLLVALASCTPVPGVRLWSGHWDQSGLEARLGHEVTGSSTFSPAGTSWDQWLGNFQDRIAGTEPRRITLAPFPSGGTLAEAARGDYNSHYQDAARLIATTERPEVDIRFAWEANGTWYAWGYGGSSTEAAQFAKLWANFWWFFNLEGANNGHARLELNLSLGQNMIQPVPYDQFHILGGDIYCMWGHRTPAGAQASLDSYKNLVISHHKDASFSEWSGFVNKFSGGTQVGCAKNRDPDGTKSGVRFINQVTTTAGQIAGAGLKVELVPFERDPQPEGEFAMTWTEHQETYDEQYCGWANGCGRVHDKDIAERFDAIFGS